jgi:hypothetical protein
VSVVQAYGLDFIRRDHFGRAIHTFFQHANCVSQIVGKQYTILRCRRDKRVRPSLKFTEFKTPQVKKYSCIRDLTACRHFRTIQWNQLQRVMDLEVIYYQDLKNINIVKPPIAKAITHRPLT